MEPENDIDNEVALEQQIKKFLKYISQTTLNKHFIRDYHYNSKCANQGDKQCLEKLKQNELYRAYSFLEYIQKQMFTHILNYLYSRYNIMLTHVVYPMRVYELFYIELIKKRDTTLSDLQLRKNTISIILFKTEYYFHKSLGKFITFLQEDVKLKTPDFNEQKISILVKRLTSNPNVIRKNDEYILTNVLNYFVSRKHDTAIALPIIKEYQEYCRLTRHIINKYRMWIDPYTYDRLPNFLYKNVNILKRLNLSIVKYNESLVENIKTVEQLVRNL